jgi:hypothetical protein
MTAMHALRRPHLDEAYLGDKRVPCVHCGGLGEGESGGPSSGTYAICLGTGLKPVSHLRERDLIRYPVEGRDWSGADSSRQSLRGATFEDCQMAGANPELTCSLKGTFLRVTGLSEEQLGACVACGVVAE